MTSARTESAALRRHRADLRKARNSNHSHLDDGRRSRGRALAAHTLQVGRAKTHLIASRCRLKNKNKKVKKLPESVRDKAIHSGLPPHTCQSERSRSDLTVLV